MLKNEFKHTMISMKESESVECDVNETIIDATKKLIRNVRSKGKLVID